MTSLAHPIKSTCKNIRVCTRLGVQHPPNTHRTTPSKSPARTINVATANGISWICITDPLEPERKNRIFLFSVPQHPADASASQTCHTGELRQHNQHYRLRAKSSVNHFRGLSGLPPGRHFDISFGLVIRSLAEQTSRTLLALGKGTSLCPASSAAGRFLLSSYEQSGVFRLIDIWKQTTQRIGPTT